MSEAQSLEWKSLRGGEYLKWICGLANAHGGVLEIGKGDCGEIVGVKDQQRLVEDIPNEAQASLGIFVDVNLKSKESGKFLEIKVDPYPNPISYKGEYHYRSGSTKQILRGAALNQFLLRKRGRTWDDAPMPGVGMTDLDSRTLDDFRRRAIVSGRLPPYVLNESDSDLIETLHLREGEYLRRAAVLLFHPDPARFFAGAFVKIGYFRAETDLAYQDVVEGNLFVQVDRVVDLLRTKYSRARISYEGIYRRETPPAPSSALREAVMNAIVHRDYSNPAPIQIRVYDDRIGLWNPGALPLGWTLEELMATHASAPQNPGIANAFFRAGMIEAWGRGIADIVRACRVAGTASPRWDLEPSGLRLEFVFAEAGDRPLPLSAAQAAVRERREAARESGDPAQDPWGGAERRPESQPESLAGRVLQQLTDGPMSKADLSRSLRQKKVSGQLNKVIRLLIADGRIERTMPEKPQSRLQKYRLKH